MSRESQPKKITQHNADPANATDDLLKPYNINQNFLDFQRVAIGASPMNSITLDQDKPKKTNG